jgi:nucleoside-diphosphate-sugar epimerase
MEQIMENNGKVVLSGEQTKRDFLFIDDFCRLIETILMKFPREYKLYNVGSGSSYTLEYVTRLLGRLLNKKITISYDKKMRTADITDSVADISKVASEFNWRPSVSIEQGLQQVVDYYFMQVGLTRE